MRQFIAGLILAQLLSVAALAASDSTVVHITDTGKKYHKAGCQYLKQSDTEITLGEAKKRGYKPCKKCKPPK